MVRSAVALAQRVVVTAPIRNMAAPSRTITGRSVMEGDRVELRREIGYVIQRIGLFRTSNVVVARLPFRLHE